MFCKLLPLHKQSSTALFTYQNDGDYLMGRIDVEKHSVLSEQSKLSLRKPIGAAASLNASFLPKDRQ